MCLKKGTIFSLLIIIVLAALSIFSGCNKEIKMKQDVKPPVAEKIRKELTIHGHTRIDNYYWLNQRENPRVIDYLKAENKYTAAMLKHTENFQKNLYAEMIGRIKKSDESVPYLENGYFYFNRFEEHNEYPVYSRKKGNLESPEEILLDENKMAAGYEYYRATGLQVSPNNRILAFGEDTLSRRKYTIRFKDLQTGKMLADKMPNTTGSTVWGNDNKTVYYVTKDSTLRPDKIWRHTLGTDISEDVLVYHEQDNTFNPYIYKSKSGKYIFIQIVSTLSSEVWFIDADASTGKFNRIQKRGKNFEYSVTHYKNRFYILTNFKATNFRLMMTPVDRPSKRFWRDVIPHREDVLLQDVEVFDNYLVLEERQNGLNRIRIIDQNTKKESYIDFNEDAYYASISVNEEMSSKLLRFSYTSMTTPGSVFDYNMETGKRVLLKQQEVIGKFNKDDYQTKRIFAKATDGTEVPISIVYKKGIKKDGKNPLLLYAYGSYGASMEPRFSSARLTLLNRGFVYAIAHIRGGQEMGRQWYENGKLLNKMNTFTDYIDCAEHLIKEKYTNKNILFGMGGSAGGLLIGAVNNLAPELFKGLIAAVPFVDVVTTMLDETIPLTTGEYDEWGNPNKKEYYEYMLSYSPYDQVEAKDYPAMLVTTGLHDSQVQYWEPAKWVAKLRDMKTDNNPLLLHINMDFGHGGASGRFESYRETAMEYAFIFDLLNIGK